MLSGYGTGEFDWQRNQAGLEKQDVVPFLESLHFYRHIRVSGLMTIGPQGSLEEIRRVFRELYQIKEEVESKSMLDFSNFGFINGNE